MTVQSFRLGDTVAQPTSADQLRFTPLRGRRNLRVLMVTPRYFPYIGGVENHVYQVARRLAHAGTDVTVLTTDPTGQLAPLSAMAGVKIQRVRAWPAEQDYYFAPALRSVIQQGNWDIMHLQSYHTLVAPLAMAAAWQAKLPYVVTFHGGGHSSSLRNRIRSLQQTSLRPLLAKAARLIAVANFEVEHYGARLGLGPERFVVIPNGCDLTMSATAPVNRGQSEAKLILSVGRLEQYKGHQRIIAAMPYLLAHYPQLRLRIVGEGPYRTALQTQCVELGVTDAVEIGGIPATERALMAQTVASADLVTLLSDYETHPIAALEALSLRRPVLVTDTSGSAELAARGLARAVPLNTTPQQIAQAVIEQLHNPLLPATLDLTTWDDCARDLLLLYRGIAGHA